MTTRASGERWAIRLEQWSVALLVTVVEVAEHATRLKITGRTAWYGSDEVTWLYRIDDPPRAADPPEPPSADARAEPEPVKSDVERYAEIYRLRGEE